MSEQMALESGRKGQRTLRTVDDLRAAAVHVHYEMHMLACAAFYIPGGISSPELDETKNIALEAFLLHYRNLRAFLCPSLQATSEDDVIASDFLGQRTPFDVGDSKELGLDKCRLDKSLAHISYKRLDYEAKGEKKWNPQDMMVRIQKGMATFLQRLDPERRRWFGV